MKINLPVSGRALELPESINILSTTDLKGIITSVNPEFVKISGFSEAELLGESHNIVRHPDMPPAAFASLWSALESGRSWMGMVQNRCKNGDHYWVSAYVTPIVEDGEVVEYQSVRIRPEAAWVASAEQVYAALRAGRGGEGRFVFAGEFLKVVHGSWGASEDRFVGKVTLNVSRECRGRLIAPATIFLEGFHYDPINLTPEHPAELARIVAARAASR